MPCLLAVAALAGRRRALEEFDWPVILRRYDALAAQLNEIRRARSGPSLATPTQPWPQRADPFHRFAHFSTASLKGHWQVRMRPDAQARLSQLLSLSMLNYVFSADSMTAHTVEQLLAAAAIEEGATVQATLSAAACATPAGVRALMWLWKFGLIEIATTTP
jgi:hypothetical protein